MGTIIEECRKKLEAIGCKLDDGDTEILEMIKNSTDEYIKNFCNVNQVPEGLFYAQRDMICGEFLLEKKSAGTLDLNDVSFEKSVKSIQEGDVSIVYNDTADNEEKINSLIEHLIYRLGKELLNYRCVKWN